MKSLPLAITLCGALVCAFPIGPEEDLISDKDMASAKEMQKLFEVPVTGKMESKTLEAMKIPRCGVPDVGKLSGFPDSPRWGKKDLTYRVWNYTPKMDRADVDEGIEKAWKVWSDVSPLTFTRINDDSADILISFVSGCHDDKIPFDGVDIPPFDGVGCVLAHATPPLKNLSQVFVHFDDDENWSMDSTGINLFLVAAHEFGHTLGLDHSDVGGALMFPEYSNTLLKFTLPQDDVESIQDLYGKPVKNSSATSELRPNSAPEATVPSPELCNSSQAFDAAITLHGNIMFFKDSFVWRKAPWGKKFMKYPISAFWPVPSKIDAAYVVKDTVYLFKDHQYWAAKGNVIEPGYPKKIHSLGFPKAIEKIDAAFYDEITRKMFFFSGDKYWRYDETKNSMEKCYPRKIKDFFPSDSLQEIPLLKVDAALLNDVYLYLFSGSKEYRFDRVCKDYKDTRNINRWFGCE